MSVTYMSDAMSNITRAHRTPPALSAPGTFCCPRQPQYHKGFPFGPDCATSETNTRARRRRHIGRMMMKHHDRKRKASEGGKRPATGRGSRLTLCARKEHAHERDHCLCVSRLRGHTIHPAGIRTPSPRECALSRA